MSESGERPDGNTAELPSDWRLAQLGDVIDVAKRPRRLAAPTEIPFIPMKLISEEGGEIENWEVRRSDQSSSGTYFESGDVLLARITPCFENGKLGIAPDLPGGWGLGTTEVYALRSTAVDHKYLAYFLHSPDVRASLIPKMEGATGRMRLPREALLAHPIPVPPPHEQRQVVDAIERLARRTRASLTVLDAADVRLAFMPSLLARTAMADEQADEVDLADVVEVLDHKRVPVNRKERAKRKGEIPYYGATGQVDWIDDWLFDESLVLLGEDGVPFLDPRRPKAYEIHGKSWVNNHAHVLRPNPARVRNTYLCHALNQVDYGPLVGGTTRLKLTKSAMLRIRFPLPRVEAQDALLKKLAAQLDATTRLRDEIQNCRRRAAELRRSFLRDAFEGHLTKSAPEITA